MRLLKVNFKAMVLAAVVAILFYLKTAQELKLTNDLMSYATDTNRYIAHAGGQIDGHNYTNSLEALDLSYAKGFRKFELDIILTADGHYVAAHDWKRWQRHTGFKGDLPPTRADFLSLKLLGLYTPIDMNGINNWFYQHPDTILITDKVNDVAAVAHQFIDKQRLGMELFSWNSVQDAKKLGIKMPMPTGNLLANYKGDLIKKLIENNVLEVAVSRKFIESNLELLKQLKAAGIKLYAFHVNERQGKGSSYMICNERDIFYGFYADLWQSDFEPNCGTD